MGRFYAILAFLAVLTCANGQTPPAASVATNPPAFSANLHLPTVSTNQGIVFAIGSVFRPSAAGTYLIQGKDFGYGPSMMLPVCTVTLRYTRWEAGPSYSSVKVMMGADKKLTLNLVGLGFATELSQSDHAPHWMTEITIGGAFQVRVDKYTQYGPTLWTSLRF